MSLNNVGKMVKRWLENEDYSPEVNPPEGPARWIITATLPNDWSYNVAQLENREETVRIGTHLNLEEESRDFLANLPVRRTVELLWEIKFELLFKDTEFEVIDDERGIPNQFLFSRQLSYDGGLDRNTFMEALREVHKCNLYVSWIVAREQDLETVRQRSYNETVGNELNLSKMGESGPKNMVPICKSCSELMVGTIEVANPDGIELEGTVIECPACGNANEYGADTSWMPAI